MKKELLESFIKRYSLANLINKAKWKYIVENKTLHTRATADNRSFIVDVIMKDFSDLGTEDVVLCIGDTEKVKKMLSPFGDEIELAVNKVGDRILGVTISDKDCESYCTCADPSAMDPVAKNLQDIGGYSAEIKVTEEFLEKFLKSRNALSDVDSFTIGMNKKGALEIIIGYTTANSNRIRIVPPVVDGKDKVTGAISFVLKNVFEVLKANQGSDGTIYVHSDGILKLVFTNERYDCTYYQFANKKA